MLPGRSPLSSLIGAFGRPLAHLLGIGGVIMAVTATLTFLDPVYWYRVFPWDRSGTDRVSTAAFGTALVLIGSRLLGFCRRRASRRNKG